MITSLVPAAAIFLVLAVIVVWILRGISRERRAESEFEARFRRQAQEYMARAARVDAGMGAGHPETPGPAALPKADAEFLDWLRDDLRLDLEGQP